LLKQFRAPVFKSKIPHSKQALSFIERSKFAINTAEERKGIPYKAAKLAKERRTQFGSFGGMRV